MILLITPPYHCGVVESAGSWPPLALAYTGGELKKAGFEVVLYDAMTKGHNLEKIKKEIKKINPEYVGIGAYTSSFNAALEVLKITKEINKSIITFIGGVHSTFCYEEVLKNNSEVVDFVIIGEGEQTTVELIKSLKEKKDLNNIEGLAFIRDGKVIKNTERKFADINELVVDWDLLEWNIYKFYPIKKSRLGAVSSSRGCSFNCAFCSQQKFWKESWRGRKPKDFVAELELLKNKYSVNTFLIVDEYPTADRKRWEEILNLIIAKKLNCYFMLETRVEDIVRDKDIMHKYKQAGIIHIYIGVEATNQESLDVFKKDLKVEQSKSAIEILNKAGIISETSFILGTPEETKESINETLKIAKFYNPDFAHFLALTPWPYADMYNDLKPYIEVYDYAKYNLIEAVIKPQNLSIKKINNEIFNCYRKFYMSKFKEIEKERDSFKKDYFFTSMKLMMKNSFLKNNIKLLGKMPEHLSKVLPKSYLKIYKS